MLTRKITNSAVGTAKTELKSFRDRRVSVILSTVSFLLFLVKHLMYGLYVSLYIYLHLLMYSNLVLCHIFVALYLKVRVDILT